MRIVGVEGLFIDIVDLFDRLLTLGAQSKVIFKYTNLNQLGLVALVEPFLKNFIEHIR